MKQKLSVLLINCDWNNLFQTDFERLFQKLQRDRLAPELNTFHLFSWARESYKDKRGDSFTAVHVNTRLSWFKPWFDFASTILVPWEWYKNKTKIDVVATYDFGFLPAAWIVKKMAGAKIVMVINNMPRVYSATRKFGGIKSFYSWILEKLFASIPDEYFTINEAMKTYLLDLSIPAAKIHIFAMDTLNRDMQYVKAAERGVIRSRYKLPEDAKIIVSVARLEAEKNHEESIELFATLPKNFYLFILGEGSLRKKLEALAASRGVADRVFMPGFVKRDDIWHFYKDADVFVLLSHAEALGVVVWEAMYMRVPVIGSIAPGIIESTGAQKERGYIYKHEDGPEYYKRLIETCVTDSPSRTLMLDRAFAYVDEKIKNKIILNDIVS